MSRLDLPALYRRWAGLLRYYQAAIINTLFGYGLYAAFIALGMNMYVAQIVAHVLGVMFNYLTYSRHVFRDTERSKFRFAMAYVGNYFLGLASLAVAARFIASPYLVGIVPLIFVSAVNYLVLKHLVFTKPVQG